MKAKHAFLLLAATLLAGPLLSLPVYGQQILSWDDCVQQAMKTNWDMKSAYNRLQQAKANLTIAYSNWYPQLDLNASVQKSGDLENVESNNFSASVSARQTIFDGLQTPAAVGQAQAQLTKATSQFNQTSAQVRYDLRQAYIGLLKSMELITITENIASRREQNLGMVKLRYDAGREHIGALLTAQADLAQAQFEVRQAHRANELAKRALARQLGLTSTEFQIQGEFTKPEKTEAIPDFQAMASLTPLVKGAGADLTGTRWQLKSVYGSLYPSLALSLSAGLSDDHWFPEEKHASAGLSLSLPLFSGGSRMGAIARAQAGLSQAENDLQNISTSVQVALQQDWNALQDALGIYEVQDKYLQAALARGKIANAQYSSGLISFDDWSIIEDRLVSTQKSYLNSKAAMWSAEAAWLQTKGEGLPYE